MMEGTVCCGGDELMCASADTIRLHPRRCEGVKVRTVLEESRE
jgi:hypothetical protein